MNDRLRLILALVLVAVGLACVVYATITWQRLEPPPGEPASPRVEPREDEGGETPPGEPGDVESPQGVQEDRDVRNDERESHSPVVVASGEGPQKRQTRAAARLWLLLALPLVFVSLAVLVFVLRWARPKPMKHTGPTDTTDLWQEAGKRLRIE